MSVSYEVTDRWLKGRCECSVGVLVLYQLKPIPTTPVSAFRISLQTFGRTDTYAVITMAILVIDGAWVDHRWIAQRYA